MFGVVALCAVVCFALVSTPAFARVITPEELARIRAEARPMPFPDPERGTVTSGPTHMIYKFDPRDVVIEDEPVDEPRLFDSGPSGRPKVGGPTQINDTTSPPYSAAVHLYLRFGTFGWSGCSGAFIYDTATVLTAGHCVYNHEFGGLANEIIVIPAQDEGNSPWGSKNAVNWATNDSWANFEDYTQDWAVISMPSFSGPAPMGHIFDSSNSWYYNNEFQTAGYPADLGYPGDEMWWQSAYPDYVDSRLIRPDYTFGTDPYYCIPGQSGSGVFHQDGSDYNITAVLTLASCHSVRLNQQIVNFISSFTSGCDGCLIDGACYEDGTNRPGNDCEVCDTDVDTENWTSLDEVSCDDGFFCTANDTCHDGACWGMDDTCDADQTCNENTNSCEGGSGGGDDDDDEASNDSCGDWLNLIYGGCDLAFVSGGVDLEAQAAYDSCEAGGGKWECVGLCVNHEDVTDCETLAACLLSACELPTEGADGGGDDDDDDDGGGCGF